MKNTILITGATGFIGSSLVKSLSGKHNFINIGRHESCFCGNIYWDLKSKLFIQNKVMGNIGIHCASIVGNNPDIDISEYLDINLKSTGEFLKYCINNNFQKFILISTGGVYGYNDNAMSEGDNCNPKDIYSLSKYFSEKLCELYNDKIQIIILRLFFPYGNTVNNRLISNLAVNILNGKNINLNRGGKPIINPIHITDVVKIIDILIDSHLEGIFNLSGNELVSIEDLCNIIGNNTDITNIKYTFTDIKTRNMIGCNDKINRLINYEKKVSLNEGIKSLIDFLR